MPEYVPDFLVIPLFAALHQSDPERLQRVYTCLEYVHYPVGHQLFRYGDLGTSLYFAASGEIEFSITDSGGSTKVLDTVRSGRIFGEVAFFDSMSRRTADAVVTQAFTGFQLTHERRDAFFEACPEAANLIMVEMAHRLARSSRHMKGMFGSLEAAVEEIRSPFHSIVDQIARFCGSLWFVPINIVVLVVLYHLGRSNRFLLDKDDISLILGFVATLVSVVVLNSQNREVRAMTARDQAIDQRTEYLKAAIEELQNELRATKK